MPATYRDYYQTLGVSKTASQDEIKSAFRKLARKFHPDTAEDKKTAEEKFKEVNEAYEVLGDPEKRRKYDEFGANWEHGAPPPNAGGWGRAGGGGFAGGDDVEFEFGGTGFSDFFEQMFGSRRGSFRGGGFPGGAPQRGSDVEADLLVTIEEAFHGSTRQISFRRSDSDQIQTYTVKIPKGVREGQRIRLAGQGAAGTAGAGDLYLRVKFQKHPDYEVEGGDLSRELPVPAWKCVLGGEAQIETLEGRARLRIPAGSQNGKKFRLAGHGLPKADGARGDLFAVLSVELPTTLTAAQRELWEKLAREG